MTARRIALFALAALAAPAAAQERVGVPPQKADPAATAAEKQVRTGLARYVQAFNAGDAAAVASHWAEDADYTDLAGQTFRGRAAVEKHLAGLFAATKGLTLEATAHAVRPVAPGVVIEEGTSRVGAKGGPTAAADFTAVLVRRGGAWVIASLTERRHDAAADAGQLRELGWLAGTWEAAGEGGKATAAFEWVADRHFLQGRFAVTPAGGNARTSTVLVGFDPRSGRVWSWTYDSDGGFGHAVWVRDGDRWSADAVGVHRDGTEVIATNVLTRTGPAAFTWASVRRSVNGEPLPDVGGVTFKRSPAR